MTNSTPLQQYKTLHHEKGAKIVDCEVSNSTAKVILENDGSRVEVVGESDRFITAVSNICESVRDGESIFVDLEATGAGDRETFQATMDYFQTDLTNPIEETTQKINRGEIHPPEDIDFESGIQAVLSGDTSEPNLRQIVQHYYESLAICRSNFLKHKKLIDDFRQNVAYNSVKFDEYFLDVNRILANAFSNNSIVGATEFILNLHTDGEFLTQRWLEQRSLSNQEWDAIRSSPPDVSDSDITVRLRDKKREDGTHSEETANLPAKMAIPRILKQYATLFELCREPLKDITVALNPPESLSINNHGAVIEFLNKNEEQNLTEPIVADLRHGPSHASVELDEEDQVVRIYNGRQSDSGISTEVSFREVPEYYYAISDLLGALSHGILLTDQRIRFSYLRSDDFRFAVAERAEQGEFD